jgi:hypothetical protein
MSTLHIFIVSFPQLAIFALPAKGCARATKYRGASSLGKASCRFSTITAFTILRTTHPQTRTASLAALIPLRSVEGTLHPSHAGHGLCPVGTGLQKRAHCSISAMIVSLRDVSQPTKARMLIATRRTNRSTTNSTGPVSPTESCSHAGTMQVPTTTWTLHV